MQVPSLGWKDPLEKGMATHSSILLGRIPWTEEPGGLQSMGSQRVGHDWMAKTTSIQFWRLESPRWRSSQIWYLVRKSFLVADGCFLFVSSLGRKQREEQAFCLFLQGHESHSWGLHPHDLIAPQKPNLLIPSCWGLGFQYTNAQFITNAVEMLVTVPAKSTFHSKRNC